MRRAGPRRRPNGGGRVGPRTIQYDASADAALAARARFLQASGRRGATRSAPGLPPGAQACGCRSAVLVGVEEGVSELLGDHTQAVDAARGRMRSIRWAPQPRSRCAAAELACLPIAT